MAELIEEIKLGRMDNTRTKASDVFCRFPDVERGGKDSVEAVLRDSPCQDFVVFNVHPQFRDDVYTMVARHNSEARKLRTEAMKSQELDNARANNERRQRRRK